LTASHPYRQYDTATVKYIQRIYIGVTNRFEIDGEEVLDGEVKPFGNSAHVTVPKRWRGADVKIVRTSEPTEHDEE
jgi:putative transposon-encoded protein